ncbi:MAG: histidine phosphatase family protein [Lachnospiraceae bacterium]|nr:histidine phosphatase family protein [Lachnospiraceae bacterium]
MKLIIVRHGDPDYKNDSLTEIGKTEAEALSERMKNIKAHECYVSPLGRARETAAPCLEKMHMKARVLWWLREFAPVVDRPQKTGVAWDWLPQDLANMPYAYDYERWYEYPPLQNAHVGDEYKKVCDEFDSFLRAHGYRKDGKIFRAEKPNNDTIVFFCHFGLECVLLSYLLNLPAFALWHTTIAAPTSVTTVATEERREGIAQFRMLSFGDTSHLYVEGLTPSFSGRFRECFTNEDERMD